MVPRTNLNVERFTSTLLVSTTLSTKPELDLFLFISSFFRYIFTTQLNYSLHVASFGTNESSCYLKLSLVVNLNVKTAGVSNDAFSLLALSLLTLVCFRRLDVQFSKLRSLLKLFLNSCLCRKVFLVLR